MFNLITFFISMLGCANWLAIGLFQFDIIAGIFGSQAAFVSRFIYCIIGLSAVYMLIVVPIRHGRLYTPSKEKESSEKPKQKPKQKSGS